MNSNFQLANLNFDYFLIFCIILLILENWIFRYTELWENIIELKYTEQTVRKKISTFHEY